MARRESANSTRCGQDRREVSASCGVQFLASQRQPTVWRTKEAEQARGRKLSSLCRWSLGFRARSSCVANHCDKLAPHIVGHAPVAFVETKAHDHHLPLGDYKQAVVVVAGGGKRFWRRAG